ncbi:MAG: hypothetical protein GW890_00060 [Vibrio sp.]|nr:hypothetical protein [Vibrio sp.]
MNKPNPIPNPIETLIKSRIKLLELQRDEYLSHPSLTVRAKELGEHYYHGALDELNRIIKCLIKEA